MYLFFSAFSTQIPIIHPSTWKAEGKPPILIRAMQACGALFVKTKTATNFINNTLVATRDSLVMEFVSDSAAPLRVPGTYTWEYQTNSGSDLSKQLNIIIAVVLLQTIGLFHQKADQRVSSHVYHGMLVMVCNSVTHNRLGSQPPCFLDDTSYWSHQSCGLMEPSRPE